MTTNAVVPHKCSPSYLQKSPVYPQKSPTHPQNDPIHPQKSLSYAQKSLIHPQKSPIHPQKSFVYLQKSLGFDDDECRSFTLVKLMASSTHSHVWHDSFPCVTWLIPIWGITHSHRCNEWRVHSHFTCIICLILMCDMTHSHVWHDSFPLER